MKALLIRCYPAHWRARYGDEFEALLEERPLGPFDVADILLGALDARLRSHRRPAGHPQGKGSMMSLRIGGVAAIVGAALWAVAGLLSIGMVGEVDDRLQPVLILTGMAILVVALTALSAFQARVNPRQIWAAFGLALAGTVLVAIYLGVMALVPEPGDGVWYLMLLGAFGMLGGCLLFAIATFRMAVLSRAGALLVGIGSVLTLVQPLIAVGLACFALGWFALGIQAIRLDGGAVEPRPA